MNARCRTHAASVWLAGAACAAAAASPSPIFNANRPVAVWGERGTQVIRYWGNYSISAPALAAVMERCGLAAVVLGADELAEPGLLRPERYPVLVLPYGSIFPGTAAAGLEAYHAAGGCIVGVGCPCDRSGEYAEAGRRSAWYVGATAESYGAHDAIGTGLPASLEGPCRVFHATADPLGLSYVGWSEMRAWGPAGLDMHSLDPADVVRPIAWAEDANGNRLPIAAAVEHGCPRFAGAVDVWAGTQALEEPTVTKSAALEQTTILGCAYALHKKGVIGAQDFGEVRSRAGRRYLDLRWREPVAMSTERARGSVPFKFPQPMREVIVVECDDRGDTLWWAVLSLQGLVNREHPRIYVITGPDSRENWWLEQYAEQGRVDSVERIGPGEFLERFKDAAAGAVIPDEDLYGGWIPAAIAAGALDAVVATAETARQLGLPVLDDQRGRWSALHQAQADVFARHRARLQRSTLVSVRTGSGQNLIDYIVGAPLAAFRITGRDEEPARPDCDPLASLRCASEILAAYPPNIPVIGAFGGIYEMASVTLFSEYGKFTIPCSGEMNLSFHTGYEPETKTQPLAPEPQLDRALVYWCVNMSDGDNINVWRSHHLRRGTWTSPARGSTPVGWSQAPCLREWQPGVYRYYLDSATENDEFIAAVSGAGYCHPEVLGIAYGETARAECVRMFGARTREMMRGAGQRVVHTMLHSPCGATSPATLAEIAGDDGTILGILEGYGKKATEYGEANYTVGGGTVVLRSMTSGPGAALAEEIRAATPKTRPAFIHAFCANWTTDIETIAATADELGEGYRLVLPSQLVRLSARSGTLGPQPE